jgi:hypothetical protein
LLAIAKRSADLSWDDGALVGAEGLPLAMAIRLSAEGRRVRGALVSEAAACGGISIVSCDVVAGVIGALVVAEACCDNVEW